MQADHTAATACPLPDLGVLVARGRDAVAFLQGQLSNDVAKLEIGGWMLAGLHNPQGRTIALLRLARPSEEAVLAVLPAALVEPVVARLRKFVFRSKVVLTDESASWRIVGVPASLSVPDASASIPISVTRAWAVLPASASSTFTALLTGASMSRDSWRALDVAEGVPQVYPETSEAFVAQMLNLDVLGGIAFDKGCYTGQEVIARAHYRGRVKRRMQRFGSRDALALAPGASGHFADGRSFRVVEIARHADGYAEFLAVANFGETSGAETNVDPAGDDREAATGAGPRLRADPLPLPYSLPA